DVPLKLWGEHISCVTFHLLKKVADAYKLGTLSRIMPMSLNMMGKKRGMIQLFDDQGNAIVCTVIEAEPNVVTQIKTKETDGYTALQLGFDKVITKDPR